jgi:hypothetical protein
MSNDLYSPIYQGDFNTPTTDNSGYGALSAAEKNQTYFAYFTSVGGTTPEIIDQTAYFVKYLIDAQGNVVAPQPNSIDVLNMVQNFEPGKIVNVTSLEGTTLFNSLLGTKQITDVGKIETLLVSQTGSGIRDFTSSLSFVSANAIYTYSDWDFSFLARKQAAAQTITNTFSVVSFDYETLDPENQFVNTVGNYYYQFGNSTVAANNQVSFKASVRVNNGDVINPNLPFGVGNATTTITLQIRSASAAAPSSYDHILAESVYTINDTQTLTISTPFLNFTTGARVRVYIKGTVSLPPGYSIFGNPSILQLSSTNFTLTPQYIYNIQASSPYFTTGSANSMYITASTAINNAYYLDMVPKTPAASLFPINFSNITSVFHPRPGDYIRFEYNPLKTYRIYEVIENSNENLMFRLNKEILEGTNINNFVIYRVNPNSGNQIILNVQKPPGTTGEPLTGFIKPQHMTKELEDNFTTIIQKLAAEGTI